MSLIEVMVAIVILSVALLGLGAAGGTASRQMIAGQSEMTVASALQFQAEVLVSKGYKKIKTDSTVLFGYPMKWTVTGTAPKKTVLEVTRTVFWPTTVVRDTLVLFFAPQDTI
jgi:prepilin-type N-terminal cleavage/methylation domain-containing protein